MMLPCMQEMHSGNSAVEAADAEALIGAPQPEEPTQDSELIPGGQPQSAGSYRIIVHPRTTHLTLVAAMT